MSYRIQQKLLEMIQVTVWLHTDEFFFGWFYKNENWRQKRSAAVAKTTERRPPV